MLTAHRQTGSPRSARGLAGHESGCGHRPHEAWAERQADHGPGRRPGDAIARLVTSAAAGSQRDWDALVREFGSLVWGVARAHRLSDADAADVTQATWVRLLEHINRLDDPTRVGAWLATTARRECLRTLRNGQRHVPFGDDAPELHDGDAQPDDGLLVAERDRILRAAFARLRESDQALLRLLIAEPRPTYDEIAAALKMPIGSIGPTRSRALERLRHELEHQGTLALLRA